MGYYSGNAVTTDIRKHVNCVFSGWVVSAYLDGEPWMYSFRQVFRTYTETTTVKRGIAQPSEYALVPSTNVDTNGSVTSSSVPTARRIGDSNLWELTTNTMTSVETTNTGAPIS